jgi:hypothetical protein
MNSRAIKLFIVLAVFAATAPPVHFLGLAAKAQQQQQQPPTPQPSPQPTPGVVTSPSPAAQTAGGEQSSRVSAKLERGGRVAVDNFTTGRIRVVGWDRDTVEATATSERGDEAVKIRLEDAPGGGRRVVLDTAYADNERFGPAGEMILKEQFARAVDELLPRKAVGPVIAGEAQSGGDSDKGRAQGTAEGGKKGTGPSSKTVAPPSKKSPAPVASPPAKAADPALQSKGATPTPTPKPSKPPTDDWLPAVKEWLFETRPREIHIEVRVPRYAELELIRVFRSPVEVSGVETTVVIVGERGEVRLKSVGAAEVRTRSGGVEAEDVRGLADIFTVGGPVTVRNTPGDVRARSIDGRVEVACVGGRVDVTNTDGFVSLSGIRGDVDANTTSGDISLVVAPRADGRYYLKSMTGRVEMAVASGSGGEAGGGGAGAGAGSGSGAGAGAGSGSGGGRGAGSGSGAGPVGFNASLSSYRGSVSTDFDLKLREDTSSAPSARRLVGSHGDGRAQVTLDSFEGAVRLVKASPDAARMCR